MVNIPSAYEVLEKLRIDEIGADAYRLSHKKTKAHLILLDTADDNKVFSITFRTRPSDDTGAAHIMEHSVLCGSEKYPVKDPFMELAKGSLNTFLNAFTWPDKTMYPVASTNDADFKNLMSVYVDAVFHPNVYRTDMIFRQEGWRYELESAEDELKLNGVVYNEMRGVYSEQDSLLEEYNKALLFPDTSYRFVSGGAPEAIPDLSYEDFLAFHQRFYSPSNAYICLYGNMDFEERLDWLDRECLSRYEETVPDSAMQTQKPFTEMQEGRIRYAISEGEDEEDNIFSCSVVTEGLFDPVENLAFEVLSYALLNAPGAPVRQALLDAGIGQDIYGGYDSGMKQSYFSIVTRGAAKEDFGRFKEIVRSSIRDALDACIPKKTLLAGINNIEFSLREADYGRDPKGLVYAMQINDTWLHDEEKAFIHLKYNDTFDKLKKLAETDYFEKLAEERILENPFGAWVLCEPEIGLTQKNDEMIRRKLAAYRETLTPEEIEKIIRDTEALKEYQETPDREEDLLKIPLLDIADIEKNPRPIIAEDTEIAGIPAEYHQLVTSGIVYLNLYFDLSHIEQKDLPYLALLKALYTGMDTEHYSYRELNDEISLYLGGLDCDVYTYTRIEDHRKVYESFRIGARAVEKNVPDMMRLMEETFLRTDFGDTVRMKEILGEMLKQMQNGMVSSGHSTALKRVLSYTSASAYEDDFIIGVGFYRFINGLMKHFEERKEETVRKLEALREKIFSKNNAVISVSCEENGLKAVMENAEAFIGRLPVRSLTPAERHFDFRLKNEGFRTSSQVQYAAAGGNFRDAGYRFTGTMRVLKTVMNCEYLWQNIRVRGGAYGCMTSFGRDGELAFVSYRDPKLPETLEVYRGIPDYLETAEISDRDMTKYIIGTISEMDTPLNPYALGQRSFLLNRTGMTYEMLLRERSEVLNCTREDLRGLAAPVRDTLSSGGICAVGNEEKIEENRKLFGAVELLTGEKE